MKRDIILVVGPSGSGKTQILNYLRHLLPRDTFSYSPLSDSHTIIDWVERDHTKNRGTHHYHDWCYQNVEGHRHGLLHPGHAPFTVAGNYITDGSLRDFFSSLYRLPRDGKIRFAELSGGVNINPKSEPASLTDLSFSRMATRLSRGTYDPRGLDRVFAVIHPHTAWELRKEMNHGRGMPTVEQVRMGTASWPLSITAMRIFAKDDFAHLIPELRAHGIPLIRNVSNQGDGKLETQIEQLLPHLLPTWHGGETGRSGSKERR